MSFNSGTVSIGEVTKKAHFDQLLSNLFSILKDAHTFEGTKTFNSNTVFNQSATFNSGTVFQFAPSMPTRSIRSAEIDFGIGAGDVDADILPLGTAVTNSPTGGTSSNLPNTSYVRAALQELFNRLIDLSGVENDAIDSRHVNWGTGGGQINTDGIPSGTTNKYMRQGIVQTFTGQKNYSGTIELYSGAKIDEITTNSSTNSVAIQAVLRSATTGAESVISLKTKVIEIGDWNMDVTTAVNVSHGLGSDWNKIRFMQVVIRNDDDAAQDYLMVPPRASSSEIFISGVGSTVVSMGRLTGSIFDSTDYDDVGYNRGWIYIVYQK